MFVNRDRLLLTLALLLIAPWATAADQPPDGPRDGRPYLTRDELIKKYDQDANGDLSPAERRTMVQDIIEGRVNVPPPVREKFRKMAAGVKHLRGQEVKVSDEPIEAGINR